VEKDDLQRKELQDKIEEEMRLRLGREKRFQAMMAKHEKEDQIKYKKLTLHVAGMREYAFDSNGNPITMREKKP
jgi:D-tyrosyl-tRNA(Tyr) deacylase